MVDKTSFVGSHSATSLNLLGGVCLRQRRCDNEDTEVETKRTEELKFDELIYVWILPLCQTDLVLTLKLELARI